MVLQSIENNVDEQFLTVKLSSGLTLVMNPKRGFTKTMGLMGVKFGSADSHLPANGGGASRALPDGTAHFLEHKLFEDADGDVSDRFAANGALCNASTGFTTTSYMFSCTDKVADNLRLLLSFVQSPYFTEELVRKEQGIIQQEIKMYDDDPGWIVFFNLMKSLYREHPIRQNIAGSVASIAQITPSFLEECYRCFYRPGNMALILVGGFDSEEVLDVVTRDADGRKADGKGLNHRFFTETDRSIASSEEQAEMIVYRPKFLLGFKEAVLCDSGRETERIELRTQLVLDCLLSKSSPAYEKLYAEDLIDDSFSAYYSGYGDSGHTIISADTKEPERLKERLLAILETARTEGIEKETFERIRNKYLGNYVRMFNSIESTAYSFLGCFFRGLWPSELIDVIREVTCEELIERLSTHFDPDNLSVSLILPLNQPG